MGAFMEFEHFSIPQPAGLKIVTTNYYDTIVGEVWPRIPKIIHIEHLHPWQNKSSRAARIVVCHTKFLIV